MVKTSAEVDRLVAPLHTIVNTTLQNTMAIRSLMQATNPGGTAGTATMTPEQHDALVKDWADFWWKVVSRPEEGRARREDVPRSLDANPRSARGREGRREAMTNNGPRKGTK